MYLKVAKRVDLKSFHYKEKTLQLCTVMNVNQTYCGENFTINTNIELCYIPENNIMLYTNNISNKI